MMEDSTEAPPKTGLAKCASYWKQWLILLILVGAITFLVVDIITQSCTLVEPESARRIRLFCADSVELTATNTYDETQPFICFNASLPETDDNAEDRAWMVGPNGDTCEKPALCTEVGVTAFVQWFQDNPVLGFFVTALGYCVASILLIPGSLLTLGSGLAFGSAYGLGIGTLLGTLAVWLGATGAAVISFLMGRYLLKSQAEKLSKKFASFKAVDHVLGTNGLKLVLLLRLSPAVPFSVFNLLMGGTSCSIRDYVIGTAVGIIPGTTVYVFLGATIATIAANAMATNESGSAVFTAESCVAPDTTVESIILIVGIITTVIALVIIVRYARQQYIKIIAEEEEREKKEGLEEGGSKKVVEL